MFYLRVLHKSSEDKIQKTIDCKTCEKPVSQVEQIFQEELKKLKRQEKKANGAVWKEATYETQNVNINTNLLNVVSAPVSAIGPSRALNDAKPSYPDDPSMPHLEDIYASPSAGIFTDSCYDDEGVVTDFNNLETTVTVSPTPTTRIHTIHSKTKILGDTLSDVQTRSKVHKNSEAHALKAIGTKWVYRNKNDERGVVVRNKARLVAQRHRQEEGIEYDEVFAPVARIEAIRIFLAFTSYMGENISESSDDSTNVVNAPREPFIVKKDHGVNPLHIVECCCECGNALDGIYCQQCICKSCGKGAHTGYNCPPKVPIISNPEPGPHETFQCQPTNEEYYHEQNSCYNSNSFGFDHCQTPQYTVNHPIFNAHNDLLSSRTTLMEQMTTLTSMCELVCQIFQKKQEEKRIEEEQAANARYWKIPACCNDDDDYNSAITPVLSTKETENSLSMGDEYLDTIPAMESDEVIKSSVENLVSILSESEGIPDTMCDVHPVNNPTPLEAKDHFEIVINSNDDISSSDEDSLYNENIEYVEASPHDSKLVSLEAAEIVILKVEEIEDDNLREKLLNVHLLIANIEALNFGLDFGL
nr:copia protein [Tanacetum cinerariifolium]